MPGRLKSLWYTLHMVLAAIVPHACVASVFVPEGVREGHADVPKLAQSFGYMDALCELDVVQVSGAAGCISMEFAQTGLRAGEVIDARYGYDLKKVEDLRSAARVRISPPSSLRVCCGAHMFASPTKRPSEPGTFAREVALLSSIQQNCAKQLRCRCRDLGDPLVLQELRPAPVAAHGAMKGAHIMRA